jgi:uncharacterized protein YggU (UPF0235/DUF167 family)
VKKTKLVSDEVERIKEYVVRNNFIINVKVVPKSRADDVFFENDLLKIKVKEIPEDGRANMAVRSVLAGVLDISIDNVIIARGEHSGNKLIKIMAF